jgi:hypothetical protein
MLHAVLLSAPRRREGRDLPGTDTTPPWHERRFGTGCPAVSIDASMSGLRAYTRERPVRHTDLQPTRAERTSVDVVAALL